MIQPLSWLVVADNSGAKTVMCIHVSRGAKRAAAKLGDQVVVSVKSAIPNAGVKAKEIARAVVVRQAKPYRRSDGSTRPPSSRAASCTP